MNTIPISHFFSARFARKQFQLEINTTQFSFRDPILSSSDTHSPLEIHIFQKIKFFALRALFILKNTLESAAGAKTLHFNKIGLGVFYLHNTISLEHASDARKLYLEGKMHCYTDKYSAFRSPPLGGVFFYPPPPPPSRYDAKWKLYPL